MKKLHRGGGNPDGEPLSAGRVEYLEAARQRGAAAVYAAPPFFWRR